MTDKNMDTLSRLIGSLIYIFGIPLVLALALSWIKWLIKVLL